MAWDYGFIGATIDFSGANIHICEAVSWFCHHTCLVLLGGSKSIVPYPAKTQEWQNTCTYPIRGERKALGSTSLRAVVHKSEIFMSIPSSKFPMFSHAVVSSLSPQVIIIFVFLSPSLAALFLPPSPPLIAVAPWYLHYLSHCPQRRSYSPSWMNDLCKE